MENSTISFVREEIFRFLQPKPSAFRMRLVGGKADGSYLLPEELLPSMSLCLSAGCENRKDFEDELTKDFGVVCHLLDFSSDAEKFQTALIPEMQHFTKKWLGVATDPESLSMADWLELVNPSETDRMLLQVDIEGAEYGIIGAAGAEILKSFSIIVIEFHRLSQLLSSAQEITDLLYAIRTLESNFVSVHARANNCCGLKKFGLGEHRVPQVMEVTLVRKSLLLEGENQKVLIPHPRDISRNVDAAPPIHLGKEWLIGGKRPLLSQAKILLDWLHYAFHHPIGFGSVLIEQLYKWLPERVRMLMSRWRRGRSS